MDIYECVLLSCFSPFVCFVKDELLAELEEMEQEELDKNLLEVEGPSNVPLPSVPSTSLPTRPGSLSCCLGFTSLVYWIFVDRSARVSFCYGPFCPCTFGVRACFVFVVINWTCLQSVDLNQRCFVSQVFVFFIV